MISIRATEVNYIKTNTSLWVSSQKIKNLLNISLWNNLEKKYYSGNRKINVHCSNKRRKIYCFASAWGTSSGMAVCP
jgi:hypothetical protein